MSADKAQGIIWRFESNWVAAFEIELLLSLEVDVA
jgi:hypothetical protein